MTRTRSQITSVSGPNEAQGKKTDSKPAKGRSWKGVKRGAEETETTKREASPAPKKTKMDSTSGVIERGHIYFFYRPRVQHESTESLDDVRNTHMLLVPRPPRFSVHDASKSTDETAGSAKQENADEDEPEMQVLAEGADAVPAPASTAPGSPPKHFRIVTIGKKHLPDPEVGGAGRDRRQTFWATVTSVGDDPHELEQSLGERTYETKTRGTRHVEPARLAARGAYAIVNNDPEVPSKRTTHFGYHISHPRVPGDVQKELGIGQAASFVLQVKNPLAPATGPQQVHSKGAAYPEEIMRGIFGKGGARGREAYGLRFARCEVPELLDYTGAEVLFIATSAGEEGLEASLGEGRGRALSELEEEESRQAVETLFKELDVDAAEFPTEPLKGEWI
ncbi:hypothetical protein C0993_000383 [Termitomyces sp. T159_Od127]|nr:hypothetical protein C0993_000383 [Termitomyces sp. T159_Od127]